MKRFTMACLVSVLVAAAAARSARAADPELKTDDDKTLYALGLVISNQLAVFHLSPADLELVKLGITDGITKKPAKVELDTFGPKIKPLADARMASGATEEKKKGKAYLDTIADKKGIKKTGTGLMIETLSEGTGKTPATTDTVKVNYKGMLIDGHVFDSSEKHGGPSTFALNGSLIQCWKEAFQFIKVGTKAKLYCPAELSYGDKPNGEIPAGATLVFEVELVDIVKP